MLLVGAAPVLATPGWVPASAIPIARDSPSATLLQNGKVLVAGGASTTGALADTELYDPSRNSWTRVGDLGYARFLPTANLLQNGKVLVTGGSSDASTGLPRVELFDPSTNTWSPAGVLMTGRVLHTTTLLPNGKVLVAGGSSDGVNALPDCELYDPSTNAWTLAAPLSVERAGHTATLLPSGKVLVASGSSNLTLLNTCELYDPVANTWTQTGPMSTARFVATASTLANGKVLVAAGEDVNFDCLSSAEVYDPSAGTWASAGNLAAARYLHTATVLADGTVLVTGGSPSTTNLQALGSAELYNPSSNSWSLAASLAAPRIDHVAVLLPNLNVLVVGGDNGTLVAGAELYTSGPGSGPLPSRLINLSFRGAAGTGSGILIAGFVANGTGSKSLLVRGDGPSLTTFGVTGVLANPFLALFDSGGTMLYSDLGWDGSADMSQVFARVGAFPFPVGSLDSALCNPLNAGGYTAQLSGNNSTTGVGLIEVYDADSGAPTARLVNISARGNVGTGNGILIAGFVVAGSGPETVLLRGIGPTLAKFGVPGSLATTQLGLFDSGGNRISANAGWAGDPLLSNIFSKVGAFALDTTSADSALVRTLSPGAYTVQLSGVSGATGVGLIEVYEVP